MLKISELQTKDVINVDDGKKLGQVTDLEINMNQGRVESLICPGSSKMFGFFGGDDDIVIPWRNIIRIGADVILVRVEQGNISNQDHSSTDVQGVYRPYSQD